MIQQRIRTMLLFLACGAVGLVPIGALSSSEFRAAMQQVRSTPERLAQMQHHFIQVGVIHEAVIRGDLPGVRESATAVADFDAPRDVPASTAPFVSAIRMAAKRAAESQDVATAAQATAAMLESCGGCHRTAGTMPAPTTPKRPDVGGVVGHMLEHQRAADEMLEGLIIPSQSRWIQGATRFAGAPLDRKSLPRDRKLTPEIRDAETRVHHIAERAMKASEWKERAGIYAEILTTCANCHSLHGLVWGPRRSPAR